MSGKMTTRDLAELVRSMRAAQKTYFDRRTSEHLTLANQLEREVDRAVERELGPRAEPMLWDRAEGGTA